MIVVILTRVMYIYVSSRQLQYCPREEYWYFCRENSEKREFFLNATYCFFFKASDVDLFFHWGRETLVPNLYPGVLYNNKSDKYTGFIDDRNNYLVGISRFRQARVQKGMKKIQMKIKDKLEVMVLS